MLCKLVDSELEVSEDIDDASYMDIIMAGLEWSRLLYLPLSFYSLEPQFLRRENIWWALRKSRWKVTVMAQDQIQNNNTNGEKSEAAVQTCYPVANVQLVREFPIFKVHELLAMVLRSWLIMKIVLFHCFIEKNRICFDWQWQFGAENRIIQRKKNYFRYRYNT